jgi:hypothetical protein
MGRKSDEPVIHRVVQELLHLVQLPAGDRLCEFKLALGLLERRVQLLPPLLQLRLDQRLAVQVQQVEGEEAQLDLDVRGLDLLPGARAQDLCDGMEFRWACGLGIVISFLADEKLCLLS